MRIEEPLRITERILKKLNFDVEITTKGGGEKSNIYELQKQIDESLKETFQKEERFMSHLTIARIKHTKSPDIFKEYLKNISVKPISFQINSFFLKFSELKPLGPVYTTLAEYSLENSKRRQ